LSGGSELPPFREEANFHPSGEGGKERLHPALFTLVLAYLRNLNALANSRRLKGLYEVLGLEVGERQLRNHVRWLLQHEYVIIYRTGWGPHVELTEKGERLLKTLNLLKSRKIEGGEA
jgi:repressor of nif and glnA expression